RFGWLQTLADGIKLLVKEDLIPADADHLLFRLGPYIAFCGAFTAFIALPFANNWVPMPLRISVRVFLILALMSTAVVGIFIAFWTYFTCATAQCKRAPFDLAEAESELVAGFHTEYSGLRWSFFFMAEYGAMFAVSGIAVLLFLGGWHTGLLWFDLSDKLGW